MTDQFPPGNPHLLSLRPAPQILRYPRQLLQLHGIDALWGMFVRSGRQMSKPITGVAVMMLVESGEIRLSDPVSKFIPEFKAMKVAVQREPEAEVKRLPPDVRLRSVVRLPTPLRAAGNS